MATPDWKGLFEWSLKYQDGTKQGQDIRPMTADDRAWFEEAMKQYTVNVGEHMLHIKQALEVAGAEGDEEEVARKEGLLEELMELVEDIDHAKDLTSIGGLETLMGLLRDPHPSLRWHAAEVAATCVQNNPPVQEWFLKAGALPKFARLFADENATCRQKGLLAVSCLIRNYEAGMQAFLEEDGMDQLIRLLREDTPKIQRKALQLLEHIALDMPAEVPSKRLLPAVLKAVSGDDAEVREAALALLIRLARRAEILSELKENKELRESLESRARSIGGLEAEEKEVHQDELGSLQKLLEGFRTGSIPSGHGQPPPDGLNRGQAVVESPKAPLLLM